MIHKFYYENQQKLPKKVPENIQEHFLFYSELVPLTRDVTCSKLYLVGKNMRRECQMDNLLEKANGDFMSI